MITIKCTAQSAGIECDDDWTPVLAVSGSTPYPGSDHILAPGSVVEITLTQRQVAALAVQAARLDPVTWSAVLAAEQHNEGERP